MAVREHLDLQSNLANMKLCAFALTDCVVHIESPAAKYLRAVHRTALELAIPNLFGVELGGYWLKPDQVEQLRKLPDCYPTSEAPLVGRAIEAYLHTQTLEILGGLKAEMQNVPKFKNARSARESFYQSPSAI